MRTPLLLYVFAFVVRFALALQFPDPAYPDAYYYVDVGRALAAGHGLNVDFIWIIAASSEARFPWSILQAASMTVFGPTALASAFPIIAIGSLIGPLVWLIARDAGCRREVQIGAALLAGAPGAGAVFMPQPENFGILQPVVAATIYLVARGLKGSPRSYVAAGLFVGIASLARNDGFLLGLAVAIVFFADRLRSLRSRGAIPPRLPFRAAVGCFAVYLLVMAPWWFRQLETFGSLSPTATSGSALWIRTMAEWNSITIQLISDPSPNK